jgi:hypothetical protein
VFFIQSLRNLPAVLFCLGVRSRIAALAVVMSLVQGFDGIIGILAHVPAKTYGPFVFALANFVGLVWLLAHRKGWRESLLWAAPLCGEAKSKLCSELVSDVECSAAPEPGVGKFCFSRGTEFAGLGDDDASLLWSCEKQFSTKELQEAPLPKNHRKLQENHDVFNEYSR